MTQTQEYMIDVMTRAKDGEQIEGTVRSNPEGLGWIDDGYPTWNWSKYNYRIKPREPRVIYIAEYPHPQGTIASIALSPDDFPNTPIKFVEVLDDE